MNLYEVTFVADTASAVANVNKLEAEIRQLNAMIAALATAGNNAGSTLTNLGMNATSTVTNISHVTTQTTSLTGALLNLSNTLQIVQAAAAVAFSFGEKINEGRDAIKQMTDDAMKLRDTLREIANLQGKSGPDNEVARDVLDLGIKSGLQPQEAKAFMEQFLGSVPAGKTKGNITDAVAAEVAEEGAAFGSRMGIAPKTAGDFAGVMSQYQKIPDRVAAAQVMGQVAYGLNEGRGNVEPLLRTLISTAGSVVELGGPMESLADLAVMEGVASTHANPYATGTRLKQAVRALRETKGPQGEWLKAHGVKNGMSHLDRLKAIKPALMAEVAQGKGLDQAIKDNITDDDSETRSLAEQLNDIDLMDARLKKKEDITGFKVIAQNQEFLKKDRTGRRRVQRARKAAQEFVVGQANEDMELAKENASQMMLDKGETTGKLNKFKEWASDGGGLLPLLGFEKTSERWKFERAQQELIKEARAKGMTEEEIFVKHMQYDPEGIKSASIPGGREHNDTALGITRWLSTERSQKEGYRALSTAVSARNGNTDGAAPAIVDRLDKLVKETKEQTASIKKWVAAGPMPPAAPAAAPPAAPPRAGAAAPRRP